MNGYGTQAIGAARRPTVRVERSEAKSNMNGYGTQAIGASASTHRSC